MNRIGALALCAVIQCLSCAFAVEPAADAWLGLPVRVSSGGDADSLACVELGRRLFNDKALSSDGKVGCVSCHDSAKGFGDGASVATGVGGQRGARNAPSLLNVAWQKSFFWDGRAGSLETQALGPLLNPIEHGVPSEEALLRILERNPTYPAEFSRAFPGQSPAVSTEHLGKALTCFERTIVAAGSPFDRYQFGDDKKALSSAAARGLALFRGRAGCAACHEIGATSATFTDGRFHRRGIGFQEVQRNLSQLVVRVSTTDAREHDRLIVADAEVARLGRFVVTGDPKDIGSFKTPTLRNVALTAPYMHDGSVASLERAVVLESYYGAFDGAKPVVLSAHEVQDIVEFLKSLTSPWATPVSAQASVSLGDRQ